MKMKKIVAGAVALCLMGGALIGSEPVFPEFAAFASEEGNYTEGTYGDLTYKKYSDHVVITNCNKSASSVDIPSKINGLPVTGIGDWAFNHCQSLLSVTIPDSITYVGRDTFLGTPWLRQKAAENPLVIVNDIVLYGYECSGDLIIPEGVKSIAGSAFSPGAALGGYSDGHEPSPSSITSVKLPETLTYIGNMAFAYCNLKSISLPSNITSLNNEMFWSCLNIDSITILNPECEISMYELAGSLHTGNTDTVYYGFNDSTTQDFAEKHGLKFQAIDSNPSMGDLDGDGAINALDASFVLMEYASIATGKGTTLTDEQKTAADVNKDNAIDALDASDILRYYSFTATGGTGSIEEYLK